MSEENIRGELSLGVKVFLNTNSVAHKGVFSSIIVVDYRIKIYKMFWM